MVELTVAANEMEAQMIVGLLRVNGIASDLQPTDISAGAFGALATGGGFVGIWVDDADLERARQLLPANDSI